MQNLNYDYANISRQDPRHFSYKLIQLSRWAPPRPPRSRGFYRGRCFSEYVFTEICLRILILPNTFFVCFLETFSSGGVPPDAPGDAKVSLGNASGDQVCFSSILKWFWGPFRDPWGTHVLTFSTLIFIVVSGTVQDGLKTRFYRFRLHFRRRFATLVEPFGR